MGTEVSKAFETKSSYLLLQSVNCRNAKPTFRRDWWSIGKNIPIPCEITCQKGKCYGKAENHCSYGMDTKEESHPKTSHWNRKCEDDFCMRKQNYHLYFSENECNFVIQNLIWFQNKLHESGHYTDAVNDLIIKFSKIKRKKIRVK